MFCSKCGLENQDNPRFCHACGYELRKSVPEGEQATPGITLDPEKNFTEDLGNGVQLEMNWIPSGEFMMGSPDTEPKRIRNEGPQTSVQVDGFWMGKYAITQEQYQQITGTNPSNHKCPQNPVEYVSWHDAMAFCNELGKKAGKNFTLPTEAQWEYACRAGSQTRFFFGDSHDALGEYAWYCANADYSPHPVGLKKPNAFELYDILGNVRELLLTLVKEYPYSDLDGRNKPKAPGDRAIRGAAWNFPPDLFRSALRGRLDPTDSTFGNGFRVVCIS